MTANREHVDCAGVGTETTRVVSRMCGLPHRGCCRACDQVVALNPGGIVLRHTRPGPLIQSRRNRETGTTVDVYDLDAPGAPLDRDDGFGGIAEPRWMTLCVDHSRLCTHYTRATAISHASLPSGWCGVCAGTEPLDED
jgi:hypothetical protein